MAERSGLSKTGKEVEEEQEDMETSTEEQRNREEVYHLYSPCYFFEQVTKAFLKCLGHDSSHSTTEQEAQDPPSHAERDMKINVNLSLSLSLTHTHTHTNTYIHTKKFVGLMCFCNAGRVSRQGHKVNKSFKTATKTTNKQWRRSSNQQSLILNYLA